MTAGNPRVMSRQPPTRATRLQPIRAARSRPLPWQRFHHFRAESYGGARQQPQHTTT